MTIHDYLLKYCLPNQSVSTGENIDEFYHRANMMIDLSSPKEVNPAADVNILQAVYYGTPVIVPTHNGIHALIISGKHGIAINSDYKQAIAETINDIIATPNLFERLSEACLNHPKLFNPILFGSQFTHLFKDKKPVHTIT
jgi:glycosyltransferase involved in cell wall biosynthesis